MVSSWLLGFTLSAHASLCLWQAHIATPSIGPSLCRCLHSRSCSHARLHIPQDRVSVSNLGLLVYPFLSLHRTFFHTSQSCSFRIFSGSRLLLVPHRKDVPLASHLVHHRPLTAHAPGTNILMTLHYRLQYIPHFVMCDDALLHFIVRKHAYLRHASRAHLPFARLCNE